MYIWLYFLQCGIYDYIWTNIAHFVIESILSLFLYLVMERLDSIYMWDHLGTSWGEHTRCPGSSSWPCWPYWPWAFRVVGEDFCEVLYMYFSLAVELLNRAWQFLRSLFWPMSNFFLWSWPSNIIIISISGATNAHAHYYSSKCSKLYNTLMEGSCQWQWFGQLWGTTEQPTRRGFQTFAIFIPILGNLHKAVPFAKYYSAQLFPGKHRPNKRTWPSRWRSWPILTWKRLTRPQGIEQGRCGIVMALQSGKEWWALSYQHVTSYTGFSHCFTSLLIFAAFSGLNVHVCDGHLWRWIPPESWAMQATQRVLHFGNSEAEDQGGCFSPFARCQGHRRMTNCSLKDCSLWVCA